MEATAHLPSFVSFLVWFLFFFCLFLLFHFPPPPLYRPPRLFGERHLIPPFLRLHLPILFFFFFFTFFAFHSDHSGRRRPQRDQKQKQTNQQRTRTDVGSVSPLIEIISLKKKIIINGSDWKVRKSLFYMKINFKVKKKLALPLISHYRNQTWKNVTFEKPNLIWKRLKNHRIKKQNINLKVD